MARVLPTDTKPRAWRGKGTEVLGKGRRRYGEQGKVSRSPGTEGGASRATPTSGA